MLLLAGVVVVLAFALTAFWPNQTGPAGVVEPTPAPTPADPRVAQGRTLASTYGCVACHSSDGSRAVGPTWRGLYGTQQTLDTGQTVTADDTFITAKIRNPDSVTIAGYSRGMMGPSIQAYQSQLAQDSTMAALIAYMRSLT